MNHRLKYLVTQHHGQWKVLLEKYHGPYADQAHAIANAVDAAQRAGKGGRDAEVLLSEDDTMKVIWAYGDPYPYAVKVEMRPA